MLDSNSQGDNTHTFHDDLIKNISHLWSQNFDQEPDSHKLKSEDNWNFENQHWMPEIILSNRKLGKTCWLPSDKVPANNN